MKNKKILICVLLVVFVLTGLTACGGKKEQTLSGSYTSQDLFNQMNYTFDEDKNVTVRFLVGGYAVSSYTGTYEISDDGAIITFDFPTGGENADSNSNNNNNNNNNNNIPNGIDSLGGAFSLKQEEDCIWIGTVCYYSDAAKTGNE